MNQEALLTPIGFLYEIDVMNYQLKTITNKKIYYLFLNIITIFSSLYYIHFHFTNFILMELPSLYIIEGPNMSPKDKANKINLFSSFVINTINLTSQ